jgi:hypothetical protein
MDIVDHANDRKTQLRTSWATGLYAVSRGLLSLAVAMRMGEPYLSWEREIGRDQ